MWPGFQEFFKVFQAVLALGMPSSRSPSPSAHFCIAADFPPQGELISLGLQSVQAELNMTPG